jgi:hypothetical protein
VTTRHTWAFRASLQSRTFGRSGTRKAIDRLDAAVGEVVAMTRSDAALARIAFSNALFPAGGVFRRTAGRLAPAECRVMDAAFL